MSDYEEISNAITGILVEANKLGMDIQDLTDKVKAGLMGGEMYAPAGAAQKPEQVKLMLSSLKYAQKLIDITGT